MSDGAVLRFGWRRSWIAPQLRRRLLAALLAAVGVLFAASSLRQPTPGASVAVAAHDLAAGSVLGAGDITVVTLPVGAVPSGSETSAAALIGQKVADPVRAREPLTDARLTGSPSVLAEGLVAAPVRLADPDLAPLLHPGIRVDVLAAAGADEVAAASADRAVPARVVAKDVAVLSVAGAAGAAGGTLVVLAVTRGEAQELAGAEPSGRLSVTLLSG